MDRSLQRWASCGAMALTGDPRGDPLAPGSYAPVMIDELLAPWGLGAEVLSHRAALLGFGRRGRRSPGGATRLLECLDGWVAVALARRDDVEAIPALLHDDTPDPQSRDPWDVLERGIAAIGWAEAVKRAELLGVPCSAPGERTRGEPLPVPPDELPDLSGRVVVDLSALWAGPLCADLLGRAGATVVKVEDAERPDGARSQRRFFDQLNSAKLSVALEFSSQEGRESLRRLFARADVIVTSARRRAFEQLGIMPADVVEGSDRATVWVALTAHGWDSDRVGFGDDCAVAGGLVAWHPDDDTPRFAADAIADPLTGVVAAVDAVHALGRGEPAFVDRSLTGTAAALRSDGPARRAGPEMVVAPPAVPPDRPPARPLGADTAV